MKQALFIAVAYLVSLFYHNLKAQAPLNDDCTGATIITTIPFDKTCSTSVHANTAGATQSAPNPSCTSMENDDDIWYSFTATSASIILRFGTVINNGTGSNATSGYALYDSPYPTSGTSIFCANLGSAGAGYKIFDGLTIGHTYYLRFWSTLTGTNSIQFDFCVMAVTTAPANDNCGYATIVIPEPAGTNCNAPLSVTTVGATQSTPAPSCANDYNNDDIWYSFVAVTNGIRIQFSNAKQVLSSGNANVGYALYENNCAGSSIAFSCNSNIGNNSGTVLIGGLIQGNTYYLSLFSFGNNNYMTLDFCLVNETVTSNDECATATNLTVTNGFCAAPQPGDLSSATNSAGFGSPACIPPSGTLDVWYKTTTPASGNVLIQTSAAVFKINDLVMEAYSGLCGALTIITCDDNGNPEPNPSANHARIEITGRIPGEIMYLRVLGKGTINNGPFTICAWDPTVLPAVAPGGNCITATPVTINASNRNLYRWVPVFDNAGKIIAEIYSDGNELGEVNTSIYKNNSGTVRHVNEVFYLDRTLFIQPAINLSAKIRMYFTDQELLALQAANPAISLNNLGITKTDTLCGPSFTNSGTAIIPDATGSYGTDHYVEFTTPSFSGFYLNAANIVLPLQFISFDVKQNSNGITLIWNVIQENQIDYFDIEFSEDGNNFKTTETIQRDKFIASFNDTWSYAWADSNRQKAQLFYRIKMVATNGKTLYSAIITTNNTNTTINSFSIYPNPSTRKIFIKSVTPGMNISASIYAASGKKLKDFGIFNTQNTVQLNTSGISSGVYILTITELNSGRIYVEKIIKR